MFETPFYQAQFQALLYQLHVLTSNILMVGKKLGQLYYHACKLCVYVCSCVHKCKRFNKCDWVIQYFTDIVFEGCKFAKFILLKSIFSYKPRLPNPHIFIRAES